MAGMQRFATLAIEKAAVPPFDGPGQKRKSESAETRAMDFEIRTAKNADLGGMHEVLAASGLSTLEILDPGSVYWVACQGSIFVGTCGLEVDQRNGLVRSVAVAENHRGRGIGRALLERCIAFAKSRELERLYLFSKDTGAYFLELGWIETSVKAAAAALQKAPQVKRYERVGWYPNERAFVRPL
jgi:N-acetylglutamate synthase-like GNAT family acetyltransferase